jgi:Tfp pilus assembly protein PilF
MTRTLIPILLLLAVAGRASADPDSPLALTGQAQSQSPVSPTAADQALSDHYLALGMDNLRTGHADAALQQLLDSVRLAPGAENTKALGTAYYQLGNLPKASWAYQQSLQWKPDQRVQALLEQLRAAPTPVPAPTAATKAGPK